jgi:hypothetical protein
MITLRQESSSTEITFAKCDGSVSSPANDDDCNSAAFYQQFKVAVFVVLNDFKSTSNFLNPNTFKFAFGPQGCSSNSIASLLTEVPSDNTYRINES